VPSGRVIVPRSLAFAAPDAVTVPAAVTGGHAPAHAPEHADMPVPSLAHRYTARPPSVRNVPPDDVAVVITAEPDPLALPAAAGLEDDPPAGELLAGAPVLLPPLLHAATSSAAPTAPPTPAATRAGAGILFIFIIEYLIVFHSRLARPQPRHAWPRNDCRYSYGPKRQRGLPRYRPSWVMIVTASSGARESLSAEHNRAGPTSPVAGIPASGTAG
jgi:hypothetical protein